MTTNAARDRVGVTSAGRGNPAGAADAWAIVERAKQGDREAFADLYRRYHTLVRRFIYHRTSSYELADELTSYTFLKALRSIETLRWQGSSPEAWFITIARNLIADHFKSARWRLAAHHVDDSDAALAAQVDPAPGPEETTLDAITNRTLRAAIADLPDKQRTVIELRYLADLSVEETQARTGWTEGQVKALTYRAIRRLGRTLPREAIAA